MFACPTLMMAASQTSVQRGHHYRHKQGRGGGGGLASRSSVPLYNHETTKGPSARHDMCGPGTYSCTAAQVALRASSTLHNLSRTNTREKKLMQSFCSAPQQQPCSARTSSTQQHGSTAATEKQERRGEQAAPHLVIRAHPVA